MPADSDASKTAVPEAKAPPTAFGKGFITDAWYFAALTRGPDHDAPAVEGRLGLQSHGAGGASGKNKGRPARQNHSAIHVRFPLRAAI